MSTTTNHLNNTDHLINETVSIDIEVPAEAVFALVTDITRMGEWSPETIAASWLDDVDHAAVGHRFEGRNKLGFLSWATKPTITELESGRTFAFKVPGKGGPEWRYDFRPTPSGVRVTESVTQATRSPAPLRLLQRLGGAADRGANLRAGMTTTLERLKVAAELGATTSGSDSPDEVVA